MGVREAFGLTGQSDVRKRVVSRPSAPGTSLARQSGHELGGRRTQRSVCESDIFPRLDICQDHIAIEVCGPNYGQILGSILQSRSDEI